MPRRPTVLATVLGALGKSRGHAREAAVLMQLLLLGVALGVQPGRSLDDLVTDFAWIAKWAQVSAPVAAAFNFLMVGLGCVGLLSDTEQAAFRGMGPGPAVHARRRDWARIGGLRRARRQNP